MTDKVFRNHVTLTIKAEGLRLLMVEAARSATQGQFEDVSATLQQTTFQSTGECCPPRLVDRFIRKIANRYAIVLSHSQTRLQK